jgi:peptide/nickel transport system substrate-binding protein
LNPLVILQPSLRPLDPHTCTDANAVRNWRYALFEALVEHDGEFFAPVLAEKWQCTENARSWIFTLREGVRFHDGRVLTARDVVYSLQRASGPLVTGELFTVTFHNYLADMELRALDERTVQLQAPESMADLLELLCDMVIIPEGALADRSLHGSDPDSGQELPPGTGPYRLEFFSGDTAVLRSWVQYWRTARKQELVEFRGVPSEAERIEALKSGSADLITQLSPESVGELEGSGEGELWPIESNLCVIYLMNLDSAYLGDVRMRQALNYAADKQTIIREILHGQGVALNGPLSSLHFGSDRQLPPYVHDPGRARQLVAEVGLKGQEILIHCPLSLPDEAPRLTEMLAEQFRQIDIDARIEYHEDRFEYARSIAEKRFEGLFCFDSSPLSTFRVFREKLDSRFHGTWWQGYHNEDANDLLSRAAETADRAVRQAFYRQAYRIYRDEAPWLYLYQPRRLWGIRRSARSALRANREVVLRFL